MTEKVVLRIPQGFALVQGRQGFCFAECDAEGEELIIDSDNPAYFPDWLTLVTLISEVAIKLQNIVGATALQAVPEELQRPGMWLVPVGKRLSNSHEDYWGEMMERYLPEYQEDQSLDYADLAQSGLKLHSRGDRLILLSDDDKNPCLTEAQLVQLVFMVLADARTQALALDQYSPFLAPFVARSGESVKLETQTPVEHSETGIMAAPATMSADWRDHVRGELRRFMRSRGLPR